MTRKFNLLAGAGVGIAMLTIGATPALAAKKHVRHVAHSNSRDAEIEALKQQVEALTARIDAQEQTQQQSAAAAQAAQQQAAQAAAAAQQAQTQAAAAQTAVPTEVKTQLATQLPKEKFAWANNTSVSGRMYFNFSNIDQKSNGSKSTADGTGFNIKRFYVGIDHSFSPIFSGNITTDISSISGVGQTLYVKKAYLQAKLNPAFVIRLGAADLPWIPYVENQYGYRHIENTLIDRTKFGTSSDWGIHVLGDIAGGLLSYQVSVVDGAGYRNVKVTNSVDVEGRLSAQYKGFYAAGGFYSGKLGADVEGTATPHTATRYDGLVGYKTKLFNIGGEYFWAKNYSATIVTGASPDNKAEGFSVFGNVNFAKKWSVFGRYDWVKPTKDTNDNLKDHYFNAGIQWEPVKIVDLALVYKRDVADNGTISTSNGTIGGVNPTGYLTGGRGTYDEIGVFGQFRF